LTFPSWEDFSSRLASWIGAPNFLAKKVFSCGSVPIFGAQSESQNMLSRLFYFHCFTPITVAQLHI